MSDESTCDVCKKQGRRPRMHPCPKDWLYLMTTDEDTGDTVVVVACSPTCALKMWKKGPGPHFSHEDTETPVDAFPSEPEPSTAPTRFERIG